MSNVRCCCGVHMRLPCKCSWDGWTPIRHYPYANRPLVGDDPQESGIYAVRVHWACENYECSMSFDKDLGWEKCLNDNEFVYAWKKGELAPHLQPYPANSTMLKDELLNDSIQNSMWRIAEIIRERKSLVGDGYKLRLSVQLESIDTGQQYVSLNWDLC